MSNLNFPVLQGLGYNIRKSPTWSTRKQRAMSGRTLTLRDHDNPIWNFRLKFEILRDRPIYDMTTLPPTLIYTSELRKLMDFYNAVGGGYDTFLFDDTSDDNVIDEAFGIGDSSTLVFQLTRALYPAGFVEDIIAPNTIVNISLNGSPTTSFSVDPATGLVTFTSAPGSGVILTWTGTYFFRCRFMQDRADFDNWSHLRWMVDELPLESIVL